MFFLSRRCGCFAFRRRKSTLACLQSLLAETSKQTRQPETQHITSTFYIVKRPIFAGISSTHLHPAITAVKGVCPQAGRYDKMSHFYHIYR